MDGKLVAFALEPGDPREGVPVVVEEPNGDQTVVVCICLGEHTVIEGDGRQIEYFHRRYGEREFCMTVREAALRGAQPSGEEL